MNQPIEAKPWVRAVSAGLFVLGMMACITWPEVLGPMVDVLCSPAGLGLLAVILVVAAFGLLTTAEKPMRRAYAVVVGVALAAIASGLLTDLMALVIPDR